MSRRKGRATTETAGIAPVNFPTGCVLPFAGPTAPDGWLLCDGSTVSRTEYAALFAVIGEAHGEGDGDITFHIPDYRGRFLRGVDKDSTGTPTPVARDPDRDSRTPSAFGGNAGNNVGSLQGQSFQTHTHIQNSHNHTTSQANTGGGLGALTRITALATNAAQNTTASQGTLATTATNQNAEASGSQAQASNEETRPVNANVNYIIKT